MQRIRKISNDLKETFLPKSGKPERRPSYRIGSPIMPTDSKKTANRSLGYHDATAVTTGSLRDARAERERRERDIPRQAMKPAREQGISGSSIAFPSSSSRSKPRTKAQEKPVPVPLPSLNHKQATGAAGTSRDLNAGGSPPAMSPYRFALDPRTKPLPSPPGTLPARKPHQRPPYSPSRFFAASQPTPDVSRLPPQTGAPTTRDRAPASPDGNTQGQSGTPSWPPEGPAAVKRQQRTPKSSIDSLYRSQTMKDLRTAAMADDPRDVGHGHSRTASTPTTHDAHTLPRRREQQAPQVALNPRLRPAPAASIPDDVSEPSVYSQSSYRTTGSSAVEPKTSLQVRESPTSRSVHVQPGLNTKVRRVASHKAQIVYPSYVTTPLPPLPVLASVPQPQVPASSRRHEREHPAAPRANPPPPAATATVTTTATKGKDESRDRPAKSRKQKERIEIEYISMRQIAEMENEKTSKNLKRELAEWDRVNKAAPNVLPAAPVPGPSTSKSSGGTRPLVVKKRSAFLGLGVPRTPHPGR